MPSTCKHCGSTFEPGHPGEAFCSPGCAAVHARIVGDGFERFYSLRDRVGAPVGSGPLRPNDFTWLEEAVAAAEASEGRGAELVLEVQGIVCAGCVWLVEKLFHRRPGALRIDINAAQGRLLWRWERGRFDGVAFARELQAFGYVVGPAGDRATGGEGRGLRLRLGLCGAFAMNTMLFVLPSYLGLERTTEFSRLFEAIAAAFATAALVTGGGYFARRAWASARAGVMNLDVPITLGLAIGYGGSLAGWLGGRPGLVYFDFVAVFSFLMLVGRWTQEVAVERNRHQLLALSREPQEVLVETGNRSVEAGNRGPGTGDRRPEGAGLSDGGEGLTPAGSEPERRVSAEPASPTGREAAGIAGGSPLSTLRSPVSALKRGMVFQLRAGQVVPVAATLLGAAATFTTEWINGETEPMERQPGQTVPAGAATVGLAPIRLEAREEWAGSILSRLLAHSGASGFRHLLAERITRVYLVAIVAFAAAGGAGWWVLGGDAAKALHVAVAVLVASCPCGIGIAFPLVEELAVAAMRRRGVFVRELSLFPRLRRIRRVVFDKTGTLTLETPSLQNPETLAALTPGQREALRLLVAENLHPTARAVHEALVQFCAEAQNSGGICADQSKIENPESKIEEVVGRGVRLKAADGVWTLGRPGFASENSTGAVSENRKSEVENRRSADAEFAHDGRVLAHFRFSEAARTDARGEIGRQRAAGREVAILSGDRPEKVAALAAALGVDPGQALGGLSPEEKRDWLRAHDADRTLMLGDGANDSLAFDAAFARGTPVIHRGVLEGKSDFYYLGRGLGGIGRLFDVAEIRRRTVRRIFVFAVVYNAGTVTLALAGLVNPLVAAVAMPVSSLLSVALATMGMRRAFRR